MVQFCPACGTKQSANAKFCRACGYNLADDELSESRDSATSAATSRAAEQSAPMASPTPEQMQPPHFYENKQPNNNLPLIGGFIALVVILLAGIFWFLSADREAEQRLIADASAPKNVITDKEAEPVEEKTDWSSYEDEVLSGELTLVTTGRANGRTYPSPKDTIVNDTYPKDTELKGKWVKGVNSKAKWLKVTATGSYVWEGNLADPVALRAKQTIRLADYRGKYPFTRVNGTSFLKDSRVIRLANAAVPDKSILKEFEQRFGPQLPIAVSGNMLLASGCEQRNCNNFNWSYLIFSVDGTQKMQVCRHDYAKMRRYSFWYEDGKRTARLPGDCPRSFRELARRIKARR